MNGLSGPSVFNPMPESQHMKKLINVILVWALLVNAHAHILVDETNELGMRTTVTLLDSGEYRYRYEDTSWYSAATSFHGSGFGRIRFSTLDNKPAGRDLRKLVDGRRVALSTLQTRLDGRLELEFTSRNHPAKGQIVVKIAYLTAQGWKYYTESGKSWFPSAGGPQPLDQPTL